MRHVIIRENARLKDEIERLQQEAARIRGRVSVASAGAGLTADSVAADEISPLPPETSAESDCGRSIGFESPCRAVQWLEAHNAPGLCAPRRRRVVEWRIRNVDMPQAAELSQRVRSAFELPEYPQVTFHFAFGSSRGSSGPCRLTFGVSGPGCAGLRLDVGLEAEAEAAASTPAPLAMGAEPAAGAVADADGGSSSSDAESMGGLAAVTLRQLRLGQLPSMALPAGGRVHCPCTWPAMPCATVVCRAKIEFAGCCAISRDASPDS